MLLRKWSITFLVAVAAGLAYLWTPVMAADPAFVGILALIADGDVATQIGLTEDARTKLIEFIKKREDEAESLVLSSRTLPPEEKAAKVKAFLDESEKQGFALLTAEQRTKLQQVRLERAGLSTLAEAPIADSLKLTDAQKSEVKKLLEQRASDLGRGNERERQLAKARSERALVKLLSKDQRAAWEELAGKTGILPSPGDEPSDEPGQPGDEPAVATTGKPGETVAAKPAGDGTLKFNFRFQPWKDVLDWFAKQSGMSLVAESMPPGTFNYVDNRAYTPSESIDLLNGILVTKGYLLLRRERMLILFNLEDEIPDLLIDTVSPDQLDGRGRYELMTCLFPVKRITPEDAEKEVTKLRGPFGKVVVLPQVKQLQVRELGGKLRAIRDMLASVENPESNPKEKTTIIRLEHISTDEFMFALRPILGMPENVNSMPDGSLRLAPDPLNGRIFATGKAERLEKLDELLKLLDVESAKAAAPAGGAVEQAQIEVYPPGGADPIAILQVMQTLIGALPDVRMATDPKTGNLVVLARPSQHATIRETLKQLQKDVSNIEVFQLRRVDPQLATVTINKLFGGDEKGAGAGGPKVESDPTTRLLIVRGAPAQIAQVRSLLEKMGEGENLTTSASETQAADRGNVRTIPLAGREAERVLTQLEAIWPTVRANRIRVVRPSARTAEESTEEGATKRDDAGPSGADSRGLRSQRLDSVSREPKPKPVTRATASSEDPENRPAGENPNVPNPNAPNPNAPNPAVPVPAPNQPIPNQPIPNQPIPNQPATVPPGKSAAIGGALGGRMQFVAFQAPAAGDDEPVANTKAPAPAKAPVNSKPADEKAPATEKTTTEKTATEKTATVKPAAEKATSDKVPADVVITIQKGGIVIASEDKQALDDLEALFSTLAGREAMSGTTREYTV
ncbi:MAG: secretin N-terminal domain-containing protein, partial [Planctomycetota bacterium]